MQRAKRGYLPIYLIGGIDQTDFVVVGFVATSFFGDQALADQPRAALREISASARWHSGHRRPAPT